MHDSCETQKTRMPIEIWTVKDCVPEVSQNNRDPTGNWTRKYSCYLLAKNLSSYIFPMSIILWEAEFKDDRLSNFYRKFQDSIAFKLYDGYCLLHLMRLIIRIVGKKQNVWI